MEGQPTNFEPVPMDSEDDFFIVYTSGTTNNPRRIVHSQAGYLLYAAFTRKVYMYLIDYRYHFRIHLKFQLELYCMYKYPGQVARQNTMYIWLKFVLNQFFSCSSSSTFSQETSLGVWLTWVG